MSNNAIVFGTGNVKMGPAGINPDWILEGNPVARNNLLSSSADGTASTWLWDCTAGKFNWFYDIDETVYFLEGSVSIKDSAGIRHLKAGDTVFFPAGSSAEWNVEHYVRKVAFLRIPMPRSVQIVKRLYKAAKRLVSGGNGGSKSTSPAMFQNP
jgi:uncharacterized cupin superfamily protein